MIGYSWKREVRFDVENKLKIIHEKKHSKTSLILLLFGAKNFFLEVYFKS